MAEDVSIGRAIRQARRLLLLVRPYWIPFAKGMVLSAVLTLLAMFPPYLTKILIDQVYPARDVSFLIVVVCGLAILMVASALSGAVHRYYTLYINSYATAGVGLSFFNSVQHLPWTFFTQQPVGDIMSRFRDASSALRSVSKIVGTLLTNSVYLLAVPPLLFVLQWRLALLALGVVPLTAIVTVVSTRILRKHWKQTAEAEAALAAYQTEVVSNVQTLKSLAIEHRVFSNAMQLSQNAVAVRLNAGRIERTFSVMTSLLRGGGTVLITWYGWTLILHNHMSLGDYIAFSAYLGYMLRPLMQIVDTVADAQQAAVHLHRMFEYLDEPVEQEPMSAYVPAGPPTVALVGDVRFDDVELCYEPDRLVLRDINLHVPQGETVAFIGPSGAGKSSLFRLLLRLVAPSAGRIFVDGHDITALRLSDLRRQIAVVWQEGRLVRGTLWDNLVLGAGPTTTQDRVDEVMEACQLSGFVQSLPDGYASDVGEWGAKLSGGEKQRLCIARALIRDASILLLDEITSNLDPDTERGLLNHIGRYTEGRTVLFVSHRPSAVRMADRICVVQSGMVNIVGSHEQALDASAFYERFTNADHTQQGNLRVLPQGSG